MPLATWEKRIKVGVIGCGSVSHSYLPVLSTCSHVQLASTCDIRPERARAQAEQFQVRHRYPHINETLVGEPFDFLINLTDMQEHERINRQGLEAGKHVRSEKPIADSLAAGQSLLRHALSRAGSATLMTPQLMDTLVAAAAGNYRVLITMGADQLRMASRTRSKQLDEKRYREVYQPHRSLAATKKKGRA